MSSVPHGSRDVFGLLLLDKPAGLSSNRALQRVKRLFRATKAGHGGSLDPLATGMLPVFFGAATRLAGYLLDARKTYRVTATLGIATTTGDAEGAVTIDRSSEPAIDRARIDAALAQFKGEIAQIPPMFSALKRDGVPLYRLARSGVEVERQPRRVVIDELTLDDFAWPSLMLTVRCSKGTYVRTLIEDLAKAVGTVGHVAALRRLAVEPFGEQGMHTIEALEALEVAAGAAGLDGLLLAPDAALVGWPALQLAAAEALRLAQGQAVAAASGVPPGRIKVYDAGGRFLAIGEVTRDGHLRPQRVFPR